MPPRSPLALALLAPLLGLVAVSAPLRADLVCTAQAAATVGRGTAVLDGAGDRIVYLSDRTPEGETTPFRDFWLYLWDAQAGPSLLTSSTALQPSISADGRRIAVSDGQNEILLWEEAKGFRQISHTLGDALDPAISGDGRRIAFTSGFDPFGTNPEGNREVFLWDEAAGLRQVTETAAGWTHFGLALDGDGRRLVFAALDTEPMLPNPVAGSGLFLWDEGAGTIGLTPTLGSVSSPPAISADGHRVAFGTNANLLGDLRSHNVEAYLWDDDAGLRRLTTTTGAGTLSFPGGLSGDGHRLVIESNGDLAGTNPHHDTKVFLWDEARGLTQVSLDPLTEDFDPTISAAGDRISYRSRPRRTDQYQGPGILELATCAEPSPPPGPWLQEPEISDFRFKVRIANPSGPIAGVREAACIPETLCVSGALPGRSEVFLRVVGPKPNGYLWPTMVKLTTSQVEVWIEQISSGALRHYLLYGAQPGLDVLDGGFDRTGFTP